MSPEARSAYMIRRSRPANRPTRHDGAMLVKRDMELERAFVAAGIAYRRSDPTGDGGVVPGYGDQRGIELLVEAGFSRWGDQDCDVERSDVHGATGPDRYDRRRKACGLVVMKGDPSKRSRTLKTSGSFSKMELDMTRQSYSTRSRDDTGNIDLPYSNLARKDASSWRRLAISDRRSAISCSSLAIRGSSVPSRWDRAVVSESVSGALSGIPASPESKCM